MNRRIVVIGGGVLLLVILFGAVFLLGRCSSGSGGEAPRETSVSGTSAAPGCTDALGNPVPCLGGGGGQYNPPPEIGLPGVGGTRSSGGGFWSSFWGVLENTFGTICGWGIFIIAILLLVLWILKKLGLVGGINEIYQWFVDWRQQRQIDELRGNKPRGRNKARGRNKR